MTSPESHIDPSVSEALECIEQLKQAFGSYDAAYKAAGISRSGGQKIRLGQLNRVFEGTLEKLRIAVSRLESGQIGPIFQSSTEVVMVEKYNRHATETSLPQWDELTESQKAAIRARWRKIQSEVEFLIATQEDAALHWTTEYLRERTPTR